VIADKVPAPANCSAARRVSFFIAFSRAGGSLAANYDRTIKGCR
jgi:hypothetical protein